MQLMLTFPWLTPVQITPVPVMCKINQQMVLWLLPTWHTLKTVLSTGTDIIVTSY
jgi:hypothetical protein